VPVKEPLAAVIVPLPIMVAVKVVFGPLVAANDPRFGVTLQLGLTVTALPYWSVPVAEKVAVEPTLSCGSAGEMVIDASAAAVTFSAWAAVVYPGAVAVRVGLPALVSW
jgi:hypothetical protein